VPDSSWFTNRIGFAPVSLDELRLGGCKPSQILDPSAAADGTWVIDKGKTHGNSRGFRVRVPNKGQYLFKLDDPDQPEQSTAAAVIGAAAYHAAGYNTTCEQIVYFKPSLLKLTPGLRYKWTTFGDDHAFDQAALDKLVSSAPRNGDAIRMVASAWLPGRLIGQFRWKGTRADDPNDVVPHEDRRELRASRLLAAWVGHEDTQDSNLDAWVADSKSDPDSSPGHVVHFFLDWGDCLGAKWPQDEVTRRMGYSYIVDWGDMATDFATLGVRTHPWEDGPVPGHELFGYYDVAHFAPDEWKTEFPNPAFTRMTERDAAWMARILAAFTPDMVRTLGELGRYSDPRDTEYAVQVLQGRLDRIVARYLRRLSPIALVHVEAGEKLCALDLAEWRGLGRLGDFRYSARTDDGQSLRVSRSTGGRICIDLPLSPSAAGAPSAPRRYHVIMMDGVAQGSLRATMYDLGPGRGHLLAGLERPER
jgi:hypothetical protein